MSPLEFLTAVLQEIAQEDFPVQSRVHRLNGFHFSDCQCYVKREDELGFGISGSKMRKYRTLLPFLRKENFDAVIVIGGAYSNNVLGIVQLLKEMGLKFKLFLKGPPSGEPKGNFLFLKMFVKEHEIVWIKDNWDQVEQQAADYISTTGIKGFILSEGSSVSASFPGVLSLPLDIVRNEQQHAIDFNHIIIDSGTAMTAIGLILAYSWLKKITLIHVYLLGGDEKHFFGQLKRWQKEFEGLLHSKIGILDQFRLHKPTNALSFGSTNAQLFAEIKQVAAEEGFLVDPIYSGKLFYESRKLIPSLRGNILLVHSGGALSLTGFQEMIK